jgi:integrase
MLTDLGIRALAAPPKGVKRYRDKDGLCLQVSQGGTKTFYFVHGTDRQFLKIGRYPALSLSQARDRVRSIVAKQTLGIEDEISKHTVQDAMDRFCATHCDVRNKPRTAKDTKRLLTYLAPIARRAIGSVKTVEVLNIVDAASASINQRRHVFVASRTFFRWAARQRLIKTSPLQDVQPPGLPVARDRVLSDGEMGRIYNAAVLLGHPYGYICLIAIHTGMRRGEAGGLKWSFITPETITLPPALTKNKREHVLPNLIGENLALIPKVQKADGQISEYLFPSSVGTPYSTWSDGKNALDGLCGVEGFVFHDFRRYLSTTMAKLRAPIDVTEAILNHVSGSRSPIQWQAHRTMVTPRRANNASGSISSRPPSEGREVC